MRRSRATFEATQKESTEQARRVRKRRWQAQSAASEELASSVGSAVMHKANQCRNGSAQPSSKVCNHCGRAGHDTKDCYSPGGAKHHANVVCTETREYAFSSIAVDTSAPGADTNFWIVDSACTAHMTHELGDLSNPRRISPIQVECGGGTLLMLNSLFSEIAKSWSKNDKFIKSK